MTRIRRQFSGLGLILLSAFLLRLLWISYVRPDPTDGRFDDTAWYRGSAHFFSLGEGYLNPYSGTPTAAWPPGYPAFLGGVFRIFGEGVWQTAGANVVLALLTVVVVYGIGLLLFDRRTALVAAGATALWPGQIFFTSLTLSEPLFTFLFALAVLLMLAVPRVRAWRGGLIIAFGAVTGLAVFTRGQAVLLIPLAFIAWGMAGSQWRPAAGWAILASAVLVIMLVPWVVRNQREIGAPVLVATNFGPNCWIGNHTGSTGRMNIPEVEPPQASRAGLTQGEYEVKTSNLALRACVKYILTHPMREVELTGVKIRAMYEADSTALDWNAAYQRDYYFSQSFEESLRSVTNGYWFAMLILSVAGLIASRTRLGGPIGVLPILVLSWTAFHLLFFGDSRFHYPIVFAFALLGARGLVVIFDALRRPQPSLEKRYAAA
jgi:4-amino-4-deoxy-L-arabinose transferase-like glycosyltransferase